MILITSAAYINPSLTSELGVMPPCMLPVQNRRLYMHQLSLFENSGEAVYLSLPATYTVPPYDQEQLNLSHVEVISVPVNLSLGQSIVYCLNTVGRFSEPLYVLHGDTLFRNLELLPDSYVVAKAEDNYSWAAADSLDQNVYAGFFAFSSQSLLIKSITEQNNNFIIVKMNGVDIKLYDNGKLNVMDAILSFGMSNKDIFPKRGEDLHFKVNGAERTVKGQNGDSSIIIVQHNCRIPAAQGNEAAGTRLRSIN